MGRWGAVDSGGGGVGAACNTPWRTTTPPRDNPTNRDRPPPGHDVLCGVPVFHCLNTTFIWVALVSRSIAYTMIV